MISLSFGFCSASDPTYKLQSPNYDGYSKSNYHIGVGSDFSITLVHVAIIQQPAEAVRRLYEFMLIFYSFGKISNTIEFRIQTIELLIKSAGSN